MGSSFLNKFRIFIASVIVAIWVITLILDASIHSYSIPPTVHGLMVMVATYLFGPVITRRDKDDA